MPETNHRPLARADESVGIDIDREDPIAKSVRLIVGLPVFVRLEAGEVRLVFRSPFLVVGLLFPNPDRPVVATGDDRLGLCAFVENGLNRAYGVGVTFEARNLHFLVDVVDPG